MRRQEVSGLESPLALQVCDSCVFECSARGMNSASSVADIKSIEFLIGAGGYVTGCSNHSRCHSPMIGEGLSGWYPTDTHLNAAEIVSLGSFRIELELCPICRRAVPTDGAHAVRKKAGGRSHGRDGFQIELCRSCHTRLDTGGFQSIGVRAPRYDDRGGFAIELIEFSGFLRPLLTRELHRLRGSVYLDGTTWKGGAWTESA